MIYFHKNRDTSGKTAMASWAVGAVMAAVMAVIGVSGCSSSQTTSQRTQPEMQVTSALGNVEYHTYLLANELFADVTPSRQYRYAVVGFVPVDTMKYDPNHQQPLMMLGHQLEQGMITEASKRGFSTKEFKISNDIIVSEQSDQILTRDIDRLHAGGRGCLGGAAGLWFRNRPGAHRGTRLHPGRRPRSRVGKGQEPPAPRDGHPWFRQPLPGGATGRTGLRQPRCAGFRAV